MSNNRFAHIQADTIRVSEETAALANCYKELFNLQDSISNAIGNVVTNVDEVMANELLEPFEAIEDVIGKYIGLSVWRNATSADSNEI